MEPYYSNMHFMCLCFTSLSICDSGYFLCAIAECFAHFSHRRGVCSFVCPSVRPSHS